MKMIEFKNKKTKKFKLLRLNKIKLILYKQMIIQNKYNKIKILQLKAFLNKHKLIKTGKASNLNKSLTKKIRVSHKIKRMKIINSKKKSIRTKSLKKKVKNQKNQKLQKFLKILI